MKEPDLRKRLFCAFFLIIFVPLPVLFAVGIKGVVPYMQKAEMDRMMRETMATVGDVQSALKGFKSDVLILSESDELKDLLETRDSAHRQKLRNLFVSFSKHKGIYYQIRYLDEKGREIVRVDDGIPVSDDKLQDKSDRYYFRESIKFPKGSVYVSPLDLNKEWGKIEVPFMPVIRYAVTVRDKKGFRRGIVITNVDARQILQRLQVSSATGISKTMLIDSDGFYLLHYDKKKEWGGTEDLNTGENIKKDYPADIVKRFFSRNADIMIKKATVCSYAPIFSTNSEGNGWISINESSLTGMIRTVSYLRSMIIIITIASAIAGAYLSYVLARWLSKINCRQER
ncbi:MAG: cache domain-containing protein [Thermodesulfovibrionales bacterium]|nr:cache domain-containing protein [Thermodesulfovibrionales bacterium]